MKRLTSLILAGLLLFSLAACGGGAVSALKGTQVKFAFEDTGKTYGEVLDNYCSDTKWRTFTSGYLTMVEFSGKTPNGQKVVIQWLKDTYDICYAWTLDGSE
jgi:hypothetical protein